MKKLGLCVCYDTKNFGSQLQVLATQEMVKKSGLEFEIIGYEKKKDFTFLKHNLPRLLNPYFIKGKLSHIKRNNSLKKQPEIYKQISVRNSRFLKFKENHFTQVKKYYGYDALKKSSLDYCGFLTGSDQLWLPSNLGSHFFTQEFVDDSVTKIAYATSFGVSSIPSYQKNRTAKYLNRFTYLSSRELKGSEIIKELTGKGAPTVVDPTLLLSSEEWFELIPNKKIIKEKYIFCYFLGESIDHREAAIKLQKDTGYKIVSIPFLDNYVEYDKNFGDYRMFDVDTSDYVNLIRNAEYILTDSFHGTIFSILNKKKFLTFDRFSDKSKHSRNSRIDSLCTLLSLSNRRYTGDINFIKEEIDYTSVYDNLTNVKASSIEYLNNALNSFKIK